MLQCEEIFEVCLSVFAVLCSALQCVAVCCSALQFVDPALEDIFK